MRVLIITGDHEDYTALSQHLLVTNVSQAAALVAETFEVEWSATLKDAATILASHPPDVILLDLILPDSQGVVTYTAVQAQASHLPVIILSDDEQHTEAAHALEAGAADVLLRSQITSPLLTKSIQYACHLSKYRQRDQRHAVEALSDVNSESRYRRLVDNLLEGCQIIGFDWRTLYINEVAAKHSRLTKEVMLGQRLDESFPGMMQSHYFEVLRRTMEERIPQHIEYKVTHYDGSTVWFELSIQPIPEGIFILSLDVTTRKEVEERLMLNSYALEHSLNAYSIIDETGRFVYANRAYLQMWGYNSLDEMSDTTPADHCVDREVPRRLVEKLMEHGESLVTYTARRKDGSTFEAQSFSSVTVLPDGQKVFTSASMDVTTRVLAEKELKALYNATSYLLKADGITTLGQQIVEVVVAEFEQADCGLILVEEVDQNGKPVSRITLNQPEQSDQTMAAHYTLKRVARTGRENIRPDVPLTMDGPGLVPLALRTGSVVYVPDVTGNTLYVPNEARTRSELVIPLKVNDRVIGVLDLQSSRLDAFSERDQRILSAYAERAAAALENLRLYEAINRHALELEWHVTERTAELHKAKEQMEAIFNNSLDCILLTDTDFRIARCNTRAIDMFNIDPKDVDEKTISLLDFINDGDHESVRFTVRTIFDSDISGASLEVRACRHPDLWFDAELSISHVGNDGLVCALRDITERKQANAALNAKLEAEIQFQNYQKELHQITIELTSTDHLDTFYRRAVELGRERLGLDRLGLFLYNQQDDTVTGTYGTDGKGDLTDESGVTFTPWGEGILRRALAHEERFVFDEHAQLYTARQLIGTGWNAAAVLWNGPDILGWLIADNALHHQPASRPQLETLALYAAVLGTMLARKRVEVRLRESETLYRLLAENITDVIARVDAHGVYKYVSPSTRTIFGYEQEEITNRSIFEFIHPDDYGIVMKVREESILTKTEIPLVYRLRHRDGRYIWVEVVRQRIPSSQSDGIEEFVASARDVTDRKLAEEALVHQRDFLQLVIDNLPDLITVRDRDGRFQLANRALAALHNVTPDELVGRRESEISTRPQQIAGGGGSNGESDAEVLLNSTPVFIPEEMIGDRFYQTTKIPLQNASQDYDRLLVVSSDITERKSAEESLYQALAKEMELNELKSRFVSMASHEFRTPLATILMLTETLTLHRSKMTDAQINQRLTKMQEQIDFLTQIMDDVLQLARLQARRAEFNPTLLDLDALCRSVVDEFRSRIDLDRQFIYTCDPILHKVMMDRKLMRQIISNLVSNAVKYSGGGSAITINLEYRDRDFVLTVLDEGIGIPEPDLKHLFEPFHRADNVGVISGTGLGLTIAKESVEMHGGTIDVKTELNKGTAVVVSLPVVRAGEDDAQDSGN